MVSGNIFLCSKITPDCSFSSINSSFNRLNVQIEDDEAIMFPLDLLPQINSGDVRPVVDQVLEKYPCLIYCHMLVFPLICQGQATVFIVVNPIGLLLQEYKSRRISCILSLHPGSKDDNPNLSSVSRRLRLFLNRIAQSDALFQSEVKFNSRNLKCYQPIGKPK